MATFFDWSKMTAIQIKRSLESLPDRAMSGFYGVLEYKLEPFSVWLASHKPKWWACNFANFVTLCRGAAGLYLSYRLYRSTTYSQTLFLLLLQAVVILMDGVDGTIARLSDTTGKVGAAIDGVADRLTFASMFVALFLRVNHNNWWTGDSARTVTIALIVLIAICEGGIAYLNRHDQKIDPKFTATKEAKWRFVVHSIAMTLPWLMPAGGAQAFAMTMCLMFALLASMMLLMDRMFNK